MEILYITMKLVTIIVRSSVLMSILLYNKINAFQVISANGPQDKIINFNLFGVQTRSILADSNAVKLGHTFEITPEVGTTTFQNVRIPIPLTDDWKKFADEIKNQILYKTQLSGNTEYKDCSVSIIAFTFEPYSVSVTLTPYTGGKRLDTIVFMDDKQRWDQFWIHLVGDEIDRIEEKVKGRPQVNDGSDFAVEVNLVEIFESFKGYVAKQNAVVNDQLEQQKKMEMVQTDWHPLGERRCKSGKKARFLDPESDEKVEGFIVGTADTARDIRKRKCRVVKESMYQESFLVPKAWIGVEQNYDHGDSRTEQWLQTIPDPKIKFERVTTCERNQRVIDLKGEVGWIINDALKGNECRISDRKEMEAEANVGYPFPKNQLNVKVTK